MGCLLREDVTQAKLYAIAQDYLATMPAEQRIDQQQYEARLNICKGCPHLRQGTCAKCGCMVEIRAAKWQMRCPDVPPRW